jgi:hypothetical protein
MRLPRHDKQVHRLRFGAVGAELQSSYGPEMLSSMNREHLARALVWCVRR